MKRFTLGAAALALWSSTAFGQNVVLTQVSDENPNGIRAGEAALVADPSDPDTILTIWLSTRDRSEGNPGNGRCGIGRSTDGGLTWTVSTAPFQNSNPLGAAPICGDPQGEVMADGTIVFTSIQLGSPTDFVQSITSSDQGLTWTQPSAPFGPQPALAAALANQTVPDLGPGRQFTAVDRITGEIHIQSQVDVSTTGRQITVSTDKGLTWSTPRNTGTTSFGPIGAAYGVVGGAYPSGEDHIFQTSTNHGRTWIRNIMPLGAGIGGAGARNGITAADPTTPGRFAVLLGRGDRQLEVWITTDAGRNPNNWTQAAIFTTEEGAIYDMPWIAYSPNGALGVVWRYLFDDGTYHTDGVVSSDGGANWGTPVRFTADRGPSPPQDDGIGDDCACNLHLTENRLLTVFADTFAGHRDIWFGSFDYTAP